MVWRTWLFPAILTSPSILHEVSCRLRFMIFLVLFVFSVVPQPVYMNASELRQQQKQLQHNGEDPASHAIYSSLASCNVYDDGQGMKEDDWLCLSFPFCFESSLVCLPLFFFVCCVLHHFASFFFSFVGMLLQHARVMECLAGQVCRPGPFCSEGRPLSQVNLVVASQKYFSKIPAHCASDSWHGFFFFF